MWFGSQLFRFGFFIFGLIISSPTRSMKNMPLDPSVDPTPPVEQPQYDIVVEFFKFKCQASTVQI